MAINYNNSKYDVNFLCVWTSDIFCSISTNIFFISISVNYDNGGTNILIGIPPVNTIHLLSLNYTISIRIQHISTKTQRNDRRGFGAGVAWLNQGETVAVLENEYDTNHVSQHSIIYYYNMLENGQITNNTDAFSVYPNDKQTYFLHINLNYIFMITSPSLFSTWYGYNTDGQVLVIPPSSPGYYSVYFFVAGSYEKK